jgi:Holliday junction resolvase
MTRHNSKDGNHDEIVKRFQELGCSVIEMHAVGIPGMPDLAVGTIGRTHLCEVKSPETRYGRAGLNPNQLAFVRDWRGERVHVVTSVDEATALVQNWRRA